MRNSSMKVCILGARGSVPVSGERFIEFGGATSCVRILAGRQEIYLDAGSGILNAIPEPDTDISILFTHSHVDHLLGLCFFEGMREEGRPVSMYMKKRNGLGIAQALRCLYSPPLWPVGVFDYPAKVQMFDNLPLRLMLGGVCVQTMEGNHPGGSDVFRIDYGRSSLVYATDFEHTKEKVGELIAFSKGADILIYDGQYTDEEYESARGYGHSTPSVGAYVAKEAGALQLIITHHSPDHDDKTLLALEEKTKETFPESHFARCGECLEIT